MAVFTIGDLHLSFGSDKPMNVFAGWNNFENRLAEAWRLVVSPEDTVVLVGDISWGMTLEEALPDFAFLESLPGKKLLIKGNHDYWWNTASKMTAFFKASGLKTLHILHNNTFVADDIAIAGTRGWFYDIEGSEDKKVLLRESGRLKTSLSAAAQTGLEPVAFLHYPPLYGDYRCEEILAVLQEAHVRRCYYGHIHAAGCAKAFQGEDRGIVYKLISADSLGFRPLLV